MDLKKTTRKKSQTKAVNNNRLEVNLVTLLFPFNLGILLVCGFRKETSLHLTHFFLV